MCSNINSTNIDETLLLTILSKFKLTSLRVYNGDEDEFLYMQLLQMPSIQETLEIFTIYSLNIFKFTSIAELLIDFKRIKTITIEWLHSLNDDKLEEWKLKIEQFENKLKEKHSEIEIDIYYEDRSP